MCVSENSKFILDYAKNKRDMDNAIGQNAGYKSVKSRKEKGAKGY